MSHELKNKLDQEPLEFDASAAWDRLSPKLKEKKRKPRGLVWWWFGGSAGTLLLILLAYYWHSVSTGNTAELAQHMAREHVGATTSVVLPKGTSALKRHVSDASAELDVPVLPGESTTVSPAQANTAVGTILKTTTESARRRKSPAEVEVVSGLLVSPTGQFAPDPAKQYRGSATSTLADPHSAKMEESQRLPHEGLLLDIQEQASLTRDSGTTIAFHVESDHFLRLDGERQLEKIAQPGLSMLTFEYGQPLGPLPLQGQKSSIPYGKLAAKPYWEVGMLAGVGYELVSSPEHEFPERTELEVRNLLVRLTRSFSERFAVSVSAHLAQRVEVYRTTFIESIDENVYNPTALLIGNEAIGDSVLVVSERRVDYQRYASFSRLNTGAAFEYFIPSRTCAYAVYGGVNYALVQRWVGSRVVDSDNLLPVEDKRGPYSLPRGVTHRLSYTIGLRASKPMGNQLQLLFDTRATLNAQYQVGSAFTEAYTETGHALAISLGVGWRL